MKNPSSLVLVLLTGATGHVGFKILLDALARGYNIRLAVRSQLKKNVILNNPKFTKLNAEHRVEFVIVPDLVASGAYDEAVKHVDFIIHAASPLPVEQPSDEMYRENIIEPAVKGTIGILESAKKYGESVKRIVITSSVVALASYDAFSASQIGRIITPQDRHTDIDGPYLDAFHAYSSSKTSALNATDEFVKRNAPSFDVVNIFPSFIEGRNDLVLSIDDAFSGSNACIIAIALGQHPYRPRFGGTVHLDDISRLHIESLDTTRIPADSYIATLNSDENTSGIVWEDFVAIIQNLYPEEIKSKVFNPVAPKTIQFRGDASKTEKVFEFEFKNLKEQAKSVLDQYLELRSDTTSRV